MRISLNWLQELVDITISANELAHTLTMAGFEVEDIEDRRTWADGVVVGEITEADRHPNADKLQVCQVNVGQPEPLTIVCGAANARAGIRVPVAVVGTYLSQIDLKIKSAKLRGVKSFGMICSLSELGLEKESDGIHIFADETLALGSDVRPLLGLDDTILDVTSTANRADALSLVGIAREVAALTGAPLRIPSIEPLATPGGSGKVAVNIDETMTAASPTQSSATSTSITSPEKRYPCPIYTGTVITGLQIEPSPAWLQQRLISAGVRPINNIVDITNYVLLEWGQPLHAFDYDRLLAVSKKDSVTVGVRFANPSETLVTLDGQSRNLTPKTLVITAEDQPVALAGVMGGELTEVHSETTQILLEAALFDPAVTRRSARSQGLRTEASARYERGVNPAELEIAAARAIQLLQELAGAKVVAGDKTDFRSEQQLAERQISLRLNRIHQFLGAPLVGEEGDKEPGELSPEEIERILMALGCTLERQTSESGAVTWLVTVPPYRYRDLEREIDLIEEVARLYGYDNFCETLPAQGEPGYLPTDEGIARRLRESLRGIGLTEVMHYSYGLTHPRQDSLLYATELAQVAIANPLFAEYSTLRTELLSALILAFQYNLEQGNGPLNCFEIGRVFWREEDGFMEADSVAGIIAATSVGNWMRSGKTASLSWYEAKGLLECVFDRLGLSVTPGQLSAMTAQSRVEYQPHQQDRRFHPGRTASLWLQGERLGTFGQLHPQLRQELDLPDEIYGFELDLEVILSALEQEEKLQPIYQGYSTYPGSDRDLAFFANSEISAAELEKVMVTAAAKGQPKGSSLLESVELFDRYQGENVPEGQRSLAFRLVYRASDRTLSDSDVEPIHQRVREALAEKFSVTLRS
ncbi:phenylalanine--tRNA ligase subunit beta [Roseofilum casamattae]|uniref:Phenylalanine--tRNA ligase beta subunit n=1 Tax=Roseofilum casamattae BLCC-M143 TaxID=3022442 RepID=A0ABT7BT57_9CYAN|nr:phenylalanine--tRNA ligase subunit beta [Roseofilum casamattae]MDJ1182368.1 phenylalanine--tRNA ligase subunit beta [Roseofilum casamattae BLCC-M143]